jgi:predicted dehydrogenase
MTKILIAGLGSIGRRHLRNLAALGEKDVILLRSHQATLPEDELSGYTVETDLRKALEKHSPTAVIVANPTALHLEVAIPAAEAGCAILLEKPVSHSNAGLDRLESAVRKNGGKLLVGFQFRYHPCLVQAVRWLSGNEIGRVMSANVHFGEYLPAWHPWEDYRRSYAARADLGGGVLLTQCHSLDYLPWLVGGVEAVGALVGRLSELELDVEDTAEIGLRFSSGALATIHLDYSQQPPAHHVEIVGTKGSLACDLIQGVTRVYSAEAREWKEYSVPPKWERNAMFLDEMRHFLALARGEAVPSCTLEDGIRTMKLIDAVRASQSSGRLISLTD